MIPMCYKELEEASAFRDSWQDVTVFVTVFSLKVMKSYLEEKQVLLSGNLNFSKYPIQPF